jgi:hypothetical protein
VDAHALDDIWMTLVSAECGRTAYVQHATPTCLVAQHVCAVCRALYVLYDTCNIRLCAVWHVCEIPSSMAFLNALQCTLAFSMASLPLQKKHVWDAASALRMDRATTEKY